MGNSTSRTQIKTQIPKLKQKPNIKPYMIKYEHVIPAKDLYLIKREYTDKNFKKTAVEEYKRRLDMVYKKDKQIPFVETYEDEIYNKIIENLNAKIVKNLLYENKEMIFYLKKCTMFKKELSPNLKEYLQSVGYNIKVIKNEIIGYSGQNLYYPVVKSKYNERYISKIVENNKRKITKLILHDINKHLDDPIFKWTKIYIPYKMNDVAKTYNINIKSNQHDFNAYFDEILQNIHQKLEINWYYGYKYDDFMEKLNFIFFDKKEHMDYYIEFMNDERYIMVNKQII